MNHRIAPLLMALVAGGSMVFSQAQTVRKPRNGKKYQIVMVVKLEGVAWFDNMRTWVSPPFGTDHPDITAYQTGAGFTADPAAQGEDHRGPHRQGRQRHPRGAQRPRFPRVRLQAGQRRGHRHTDP